MLDKFHTLQWLCTVHEKEYDLINNCSVRCEFISLYQVLSFHSNIVYKYALKIKISLRKFMRKVELSNHSFQRSRGRILYHKQDHPRVNYNI